MPLTTKSRAAEGDLPLPPTLKSVPFLRDAPQKALKAAENDTRYFSLPGGWELFGVGDPSDTIYFVLSGSLGAFRKGQDGKMELVGHIRPGEPVGEMSMIAGEAQEHAVYALRDSELLSMSRHGFMTLVRSDPRILEKITRVIMVRMRQARKKISRASEPRVFGLIATSPTIDLKLRGRALSAALQSMGLRVAIVGEEAVGMPASYFDELEARNDIVLLLATVGDSRLVQADPAPFGPYLDICAGRCAAICAAAPRRSIACPPVPACRRGVAAPWRGAPGRDDSGMAIRG